MHAPMPALFVGHGNPMNAIEDNPFSRTWGEVAQSLPQPSAIVVVSAHWETAGTCVTAMEEPATLYDFHGFPQALYQMRYPAQGAPELARAIKSELDPSLVHLDFNWGLDHGAWSVLCRMFPKADVPVLQLSLDMNLPADRHYALGRALANFRRQGILFMGSGNMVHNLRAMVWEPTAFDWAQRFDATLAQCIDRGDHDALIDYPALGEDVQMAIPTNEHYLPMLYILGMQEPADAISYFNDAVTLGSISMRSFVLGQP